MDHEGHEGHEGGHRITRIIRGRRRWGLGSHRGHGDPADHCQGQECEHEHSHFIIPLL